MILSVSSARCFVFKKTPVPSPSKPQVYLLFHSAVRQAVQNLLHPPILHSSLFSCAAVPPLWGQADTVQRQTLKCLLWKLHTAICTCIDLKLCKLWVQAPGTTEATVTQKNSQQHLWLDSYSLDQSCSKVWFNSSLFILARALRKYHFQSTLSNQIKCASAQKPNLKRRCSDV